MIDWIELLIITLYVKRKLVGMIKLFGFFIYSFVCFVVLNFDVVSQPVQNEIEFTVLLI